MAGLLGDYGGMGFGAGAQAFMNAYNAAKNRQAQVAQRQELMDMRQQQFDWQKEQAEQQAAAKRAAAQRKDIQEYQTGLLYSDPSLLGQYGQEAPRIQNEIGPQPVFRPSSEAMKDVAEMQQPEGFSGIAKNIQLANPDWTPQQVAAEALRLGTERARAAGGAEMPPDYYNMDMDKGLYAVKTPQGPVIKEIPNGKAQKDRLAAEERKEVEWDMHANDLNTTLFSLGEARRLIQEHGGEVAGIGGLLKGLPESKARELSAHLDQLKSMIALDKMLKLKQASKTGATGFGQLSEKELKVLTDALGSLDQLRTKEGLLKTLTIIDNKFRKAVGDRYSDYEVEAETSWRDATQGNMQSDFDKLMSE